MSLFAASDRHRDNPPSTWRVVKSGPRWHVVTKDGDVLSYHQRKRDAEADLTGGFLFNLYHKESRWYSGEQVDGWKPYVP